MYESGSCRPPSPSSDADEAGWTEKRRKYHDLGVQELVRFDPEAAPGAQLRIWDRIEGDLVERIVQGDHSPCIVLGLHWVVRAWGGFPAVLRLARDPAGAELVLTPEERAERAERRVAELEAELRRR